MTPHHLLIACGALGAVGAVAAGLVLRHAPRSPEASLTAAPSVATAPDWIRRLAQEPDEPPPRFSTSEQAHAYYDAVIAGETRTLDLLVAANREAERAADPDYRALLQQLLQRYESRLQKHRALAP